MHKSREEWRWRVRNWAAACPLSVRPMNLWERSFMWEDPIVAEVHRTREELAAACNYDVGAFFADARKRQASQGSRLVPQRKQPKPSAEADRGRHSDSQGSTSSDVPLTR